MIETVIAGVPTVVQLRLIVNGDVPDLGVEIAVQNHLNENVAAAEIGILRETGAETEIVIERGMFLLLT